MNGFALLRSFVAVLTLVCLGVLPGAAAAASDAPQKVVIADQFGPGHLVTVVMKRNDLLERRFPGTHFEWRVVTSGNVIRDGMLSDQIQIGLSAPPPFLTGVDKGVKWKILVGAATYDQWLVSADPQIKTLKDFLSGDRKQIATVGLGSFPAITVKKAAKEKLGNTRTFSTAAWSSCPRHRRCRQC